MANTVTNISSINGQSVTKVLSRNGQTFPSPFSFTIDTTLGDGLAQFTLPLVDRTTNAGTAITVDWGDGTSDDITVYNDAAATHSYSSGGTYNVRIWGVCGWNMSLQATSAPKMTEMTSYGDGGVTISNNGFDGCANLVWNTNGYPTNFASLDYSPFTGCVLFNPDTSAWNIGYTGYLTRSAFSGLSSWDSDISGWEMKNTEDAQGFLSGCSSQNSDVSSWHTRWMTGYYFNTSTPAVASGFLASFFSGCTSFNCGDAPGVAGTRLRVWKIPNGATSMSSMFVGCTSFNQQLDTHIENPGPDQYTAWDVSSIGSMSNMFAGCRDTFAQDLSTWDTGNVTSMFAMFAATNYNNGGVSGPGLGLDAWDVSSCTNFGRMFFDPSPSQFNGFNGYIGSWTLHPTSPVDMAIMFRNNKAFNQDIGGWTNTSSLRDISGLFQNASAFNNGGVGGLNQGMDQWDVSNVTYMDLFLNGPFDHYLGSWRPTSLLSMSSAFGAMTHDCSEWTTPKCTNFSSAFKNTNFSFADWDFSSATNIISLSAGTSALSNANVVLSMVGWVNNGKIPQNVNARNWCSLAGSAPRTMSQTATETVLITSTNTTPLATFRLVDTGANFSSVSAGDIVRNTSTGKLTSVRSVVSTTELEIGLDLFTTAGQGYTVTTGYDGAAGKAAYDTLIAAISNIDSGTNTSTAVNKLIDINVGTDFVAAGVAVNDYVENLTTGDFAVVKNVDSSTQLTLSADIFQNTPEGYRIDRGYGWDMTGAITW